MLSLCGLFVRSQLKRYYMKRIYSASVFSLFLLIMGINSACTRQNTKEMKRISWQRMSDVPSEDGDFGKGVSALFAGIHQGKLILAGGCNFPGIPAADGGKKVFYKSIYAADVVSSDSVFEWKKVGDLPVCAAYGVSLSTPSGLVCVGGSNNEGSLSSVWRLSWQQGSLKIDTLPSLPATVDNMAGTSIGNTLYIVGGNVDGKPSNAVYSLVLDGTGEGWKQETPFPGEARVQPVCVSARKGGEDCLFVMGGFAGAYDGNSATLSTSAFCYSPSTRQWTEVSAPADGRGESVALGGGVGISLADTAFLCMGGVDKDIFLSALRREEKMKKAKAEKDQAGIDSLAREQKKYMKEPQEYYRFNRKLLLYSSARNQWEVLGDYPQAARAGAVVAGDGNSIFLINGELKPGIRTPEIWRLDIENGKD